VTRPSAGTTHKTGFDNDGDQNYSRKVANGIDHEQSRADAKGKDAIVLRMAAQQSSDERAAHFFRWHRARVTSLRQFGVDEACPLRNYVY
jgi:hypothetical protein